MIYWFLLVVLDHILRSFLRNKGENKRLTIAIFGVVWGNESPTVRQRRDVLVYQLEDVRNAVTWVCMARLTFTLSGTLKRIANAKLDPTFLMADVEVVTTYELYNINRVKLENLLHRVFEAARLDIEIMDRFGHPVTPREWFLVPLFAIDEAVERIRDGSIKGVAYDPETASLM